MSAAQTLSPPLRAATYETLIGLLVTTGVRIGEAIGLDRGDLDVAAMLLRIRHAKAGSQREVPLHETTIAALRDYARVRDDRVLKHESESLFVSIRGTRICQSAVNATFHVLVDRAGLPGRGARCRPRIHDLRHSFAVRSLLDWYEQGVVDIDVRMPLLSSMLGHVNPASTYWYLEAAPELMAIVSTRLERVLGELP
jgi:integrase